MPITFNIDRNTRIIHTVCSGDVTLAEVLEHFQTLEKDTNCPRHLHVLLDMSEQTSVPGAGEIRAVGEAIRAIRKTVHFGMCAIVVQRDVLYGMARMLEVIAEQWFDETRVFRHVTAAEEWLILQGGQLPRFAS
jgi:hypothetical protein